MTTDLRERDRVYWESCRLLAEAGDEASINEYNEYLLNWKARRAARTETEPNELSAARDPGDSPVEACATCGAPVPHEPRRPSAFLGPTQRLVCDSCADRLDADLTARVAAMRKDDAAVIERQQEAREQVANLGAHLLGARARQSELVALLRNPPPAVKLSELIAWRTELTALGGLIGDLVKSAGSAINRSHREYA